MPEQFGSSAEIAETCWRTLIIATDRLHDPRGTSNGPAR